MTNKRNLDSYVDTFFDDDTQMPIERIRDEIDQFKKAQELTDEGMEGWDKLVAAATQSTLVELERQKRRFHNSIDPVSSIDELYDDDNYGCCEYCEKMHVLCPICGGCLKYCHDPQTCGLPCWPEDD